MRPPVDEHPEIPLRYGCKGEGAKNAKIRRVPLFGTGLEAVREWLTLLPSYILPEHRHDRRLVGWHDLRHTCAAALVSGMWGPPPVPGRGQRASDPPWRRPSTSLRNYAGSTKGTYSA